MSAVPRAPVPEAHQDEDDAKGGIEIVVVDVAAEQVEDAACDQGQRDEAESDDFADDLANRHGASIPASSGHFATRDAPGART